jgi:hypothetical protein
MGADDAGKATLLLDGACAEGYPGGSRMPACLDLYAGGFLSSTAHEGIVIDVVASADIVRHGYFQAQWVSRNVESEGVEVACVMSSGGQVELKTSKLQLLARFSAAWRLACSRVGGILGARPCAAMLLKMWALLRGQIHAGADRQIHWASPVDS